MYLVDEASLTLFELWRAFQAGHLPDPGGYLDQANYTMRAFQVIGAAEQKLLSAKRSHG
jgi:hypothetical protein